MSMCQIVVLLSLIDLLLATFVIYLFVKRKPPRIYKIYTVGLLAAMISAALLQQPLFLCPAIVFYGLLYREMKKRQAADEKSKADPNRKGINMAGHCERDLRHENRYCGNQKRSVEEQEIKKRGEC